MTALTPEQMRVLAAQHEEAQRFEDDVPFEVRDATGPTLRAAADEVDRLRSVIENAPHAADCRAQFHGGDRYGNGGDISYCICWKADAL